MRISLRQGIANWFIHKLGVWLTTDYRQGHSELCDFEKLSDEIRPGDVILVEGRNRISSVIQQITQSPWSHAMLYIGRLHDITDPVLRDIIRQQYPKAKKHQLVIESELGKGTHILPLHHYQQEHLRICRPQDISRRDIQQVISFALSRLGRKYSLRHIFDLARFLAPWTLLPRRWRSSLFQQNASQPTRDICSLMISEAFLSIDYPILPAVAKTKDNRILFTHRNPKLFTPSDFDYSPYFSIIKYPIYPNDAQPYYRRIQWTSGKNKANC